jgi:hypothetical protein
MINPIGIDIKEPYLSWNCADGRRQTAYEIVAMDENCVVWDSSRVKSDSMHTYCPLELKSRQRISWKIRLWDERDEAGEWSEEAFFEMGLLDKSDWMAKWINPESECNPEAHKPASYLRTHFQCDEKILNKSVREHDIVGRYGGEEFVAIIHFNLNRELLQFLKRIKTIVTENSFLYKDKKIKVTFSAGVAIRSSYPTYENTLQKADMLLYQAKENGRNKIILENGMEI